MTTEYQVHITPPGWTPDDPLGQTTHLLVVRKPVFEHSPDDREGLAVELPTEAMDALIEAVQRYTGTYNPKTEAAVLREWLAVERVRVDHALEKTR